MIQFGVNQILVSTICIQMLITHSTGIHYNDYIFSFLYFIEYFTIRLQHRMPFYIDKSESGFTDLSCDLQNKVLHA